MTRTSTKESVSNEGDSRTDKDAGDSGPGLSPKPNESEKKLVVVGGNESQAAEGGEKGEINMCPPIRLGQFYDFFSFSYLTPPIQCEFHFSLVSRLLRLVSLIYSHLNFSDIRRSVRPSIEDKGLDDFFQIDVGALFISYTSAVGNFKFRLKF